MIYLTKYLKLYINKLINRLEDSYIKFNKIISLSLATLLSLSTLAVSKADGFDRIAGVDRYETSFKTQELVNSKLLSSATVEISPTP